MVFSIDYRGKIDFSLIQYKPVMFVADTLD